MCLTLVKGISAMNASASTPVEPPEAMPQHPAALRASGRARAVPAASAAPTGDHQRVSHTSGRARSHTSRAASSR